MKPSVVLTNARFPGEEGIFDVRVLNGGITELLPSGSANKAGAEVHDLTGRWVIPGLWDHHVHFAQWVAQQQRLDLSGTVSAAEVLQLIRQAVPEQQGELLIGYGFRDGLWPDEPSVTSIDEASSGAPVVLVSADLHCAWINSAAQKRLEVHVGADGLVREETWFQALETLQSSHDLTSAQYLKAAQQAARRGVVGIVEFENTDNISLWPRRVEEGIDQLRVEISVWPDKLQQAISRGIKTGDILDSAGLITMGPLKVLVDGSLNTRTAWCWDPYSGVDVSHPHACGMEAVSVEELRSLMRRARDAGISAAIHAIGDRANTAVLDTFESLGMTGVVEHAQLLRDSDVPRFADLGLAASVQPEHAMDDRDVADEHWAGRTGRSFALNSLQKAGVELRLGSDAPVSPLDPWFAIASAVSRSRGDRPPWHPEQAIDTHTALVSSTRGRSRIEVGDIADLAIIERDPYVCDRDEMRAMPVAATMLGGRFTHSSL